MFKSILKTEKLTGLFYLGLAITGVFAFLFAREKLFIPEDEIATTNNLISQEGLVRFGIASELTLVAFQALAAVWFFKLFRKIDLFAAMLIVAFGMVNTVLILIATAFWLSSLNLALSDPSQTNSVLTLFNVHESLWVVGKLFFVLWLIPMGYLVKISKCRTFLAGY